MRQVDPETEDFRHRSTLAMRGLKERIEALEERNSMVASKKEYEASKKNARKN